MKLKGLVWQTTKNIGGNYYMVKYFREISCSGPLNIGDPSYASKIGEAKTYVQKITYNGGVGGRAERNCIKGTYL